MELQLLKLLDVKDSYNKYERLIDSNRLSPEIQEMFRSLKDFFDIEEMELGHVDWGHVWFPWYTIVKHPSLKEDKVELLRGYAASLDTMAAPGTEVLTTFLERDLASQVGDMALDIIEGTGDYSMLDVEEIVTSYTSQLRRLTEETTGSRVFTDDLVEGLRTLYVAEKYDWRLEELNLSIGPIKIGDFIIVGARPDSGKTSFLASEMSFMAAQLHEGERILWFNNEEPAARIKERQLSAALNWTKAEIEKDLEFSRTEYYKALGHDEEKIILYSDPNLSVSTIDRVVKEHDTKIVVIDQLWKLTGYEREHPKNDIGRFGKIAQHLRTLAAEVGPVITTSQLDGPADGEKYPGMSRLYNSKTAVQGEADVILMIGRDPEEPDNMRFLHTPKNKLSFGVNKYRNACWPVEIDGPHARFISKVKVIR